VGKGFSHAVGVTAAGGSEGQSPYGNPPLRIWVPIPPSPFLCTFKGKKPLGSRKSESEMDYRNQEMKLYLA